ncbi:hypothetical protein HK104_010252 [Borealophlyctis nickersoniae]|nr:hypothetical protein HK104_010252 [Borealophlyctis nickersoniae]
MAPRAARAAEKFGARLNPCGRGRVDLVGALPPQELLQGGAIPFLPVHEQLRILKAKEKQLLLKRWRNLWEQVRPPRPRWYELRGPEFNVEARKCKDLLANPGKTNGPPKIVDVHESWGA